MDSVDIIWGLVLIAAGMFIAIYGVVLFKFALAAMGFGLGFAASWWLLDSVSDGMRLLVSLAIGGIVGVLLFALVRFGVYIAGAILGLILAVLVGGVIDILTDPPSNVVMTILAVGGICGGGFLGGRLGTLIILLATAASGAFLIVDGLRFWYAGRIGGDIDDPTEVLTQKFTLTLFIVFAILSFLSQHNSQRLRQRVLR